MRNLCALRGLDTIAGAGLASAIGDPSRFASAPDFMAYIGLVPSEHSSGPKRRMGGVTKAGDVHARTLLVEAAHTYRFPARVARHKLAAVEVVPEAVRAIAWKAQLRLCQRYRHMIAKGKMKQVVVTAIARELAGSSGPLPASRRILLTTNFAVRSHTINPAADRTIGSPFRRARRRAGTGQGNPR